MSTILHSYPSSRNPAITYDIIKGDDDVVYCTCPAWKYHRDCKHLREWREKGRAFSQHIRDTYEDDILSKLKGVYNESPQNV